MKCDEQLMRILIYTHPFPPIVGGAERYILLLAEGLSTLIGQGPIEVIVATATPADGFDDSKLGFRVVRQPSLLKLTKLVHQADIVQLAGPCFLPLFIAWLIKKPVIIEHHGYPPVCPNGLLFYEPTKTVCPGHFLARHYAECLRCNGANSSRFDSLRKLLLTFPRRWLCQHADANIPITRHVHQRLALPRSRVIYYGIPEETAGTESQLHAIRSSTEDDVCFAYIGRLVSLKGLSLILQAVKNLQAAGYHFHVKFVGDGPDRGKLESEVERLGLEEYVEFTGFLTGNLFRVAVEKISAVLMPSIWEETAGLAAIEQMMRGKLVIASDIGGLGEVVGDCGLRFPAGNLEALTQCMRTVLDNPGIIQLKGEAARRRAQNRFSQHRMVREHLELYSQLLKSGDIGSADIGI
jgi:glycogen(starch) synthase